MYEKMYHILFNAITDSLEESRQMNFGHAALLLEEAQRQAEEVYMREAKGYLDEKPAALS